MSAEESTPEMEVWYDNDQIWDLDESLFGGVNRIIVLVEKEGRPAGVVQLGVAPRIRMKSTIFAGMAISKWGIFPMKATVPAPNT